MPGAGQVDTVRIRRTPETDRLGYADRWGLCYGFTTPSVTGVAAIGDRADNYALHVHFDEEDLEDAWFSADLVEFMHHTPGTAMSLGTKSFVRRADGTWEEQGGFDQPP